MDLRQQFLRHSATLSQHAADSAVAAKHQHEAALHSLLDSLASVKREILNTRHTGKCSAKPLEAYLGPGKLKTKVVKITLEEAAAAKYQCLSQRTRASATSTSLTRLSFRQRPSAAASVASPSLLRMTSLERNECWEQQRMQHREQLKNQQVKRELDYCTFTPHLFDRMVSSSPVYGNNSRPLTSYANKFRQRQAQRETPVSPSTDKPIESRPLSCTYLEPQIDLRMCLDPRPTSCTYQGPLSPVPFQIKHKNGFDLARFKKQARKTK